MNKQKRTFIVLVIVLVACLAGYLGLLNYNKYHVDDSETEDDTIEALALDAADVNSFSFLIDGEEYTFVRNEDAQSDEDESTESDTDTNAESTESDGDTDKTTDTESDNDTEATEMMESSDNTESTEDTEEEENNEWRCENDTSVKINTSKITAMLSAAVSISASEKFDSDTDTSEFGFDEPNNIVTLYTDDATYTIVIGAKNKMLSETYLQIDDEIYLADTTLIDKFAVSFDELVAN